MAQLVAFEHWINLIKTHQETQPQVFFQDPDFNALDCEFLTSRGYTVIETPKSNDVITEKSFLFTPCACYQVAYVFLHQAFPALYLGISLEEDWDCVMEKGVGKKMLDRFLHQRDRAFVAISTHVLDYEREYGIPTPSIMPPEEDWQMIASAEDCHIAHPLYYRPKYVKDVCLEET